MLIYMSVIHQPFWIVSLFLRDKKVRCVLVCSSIFYDLPKMDQRNCIKKFCVRNEIKNEIKKKTICLCTTFKMLTVASLLWAEHKVNCGISGLRKAEKMSMTMLVLISWACQNSMITLKQWRKLFWINVESLSEEVANNLGISFGSCKAFFMDVLRISGSEDCSKIAKMLSKNNVTWTSLRRCWRSSTTMQICSKRS